MKLVQGLVLFTFVWWIVLFAVLPFGVRTQGEEGEVVPGTPESAPAKPRMLRVFLINTVVASIVFAIVYMCIVNRWSIDITTLLDNAKKSSPIQ